MSGKCPVEWREDFIVDVRAGWTNNQLAEKYKCHERTVRKRKASLRKDGLLDECGTNNIKENLVTIAITGNYCTAQSTDKRIRTEGDLRAVSQLSEEEWECLYFKAGTYEGFAKKEDKDLVFQNGVSTGHVKSKGIIIAPMFRTEGRFIKCKPVPIQPMLQPVACPVTYHKPPHPMDGNIKVALVGADAHFGYRQSRVGAQLKPFHDRRALDVFLQLADYLQPNLIKLLGDWNDLPEATDKFVRSPDMRRLMQPAIEEGHWYRRQLRESCQDSSIEEHEGNHEARLHKYLASHCEWALGLERADAKHLGPVLSLPFLLALDSLGIEWIGNYPDDVTWINEELYIYHGDVISAVSGNAASKIVREVERSCIFGHGHNRQSASATKHVRDGTRTIVAHGIGCLCRIDSGGPPAKSKRYNWQNGVAVVEYTDTDYNIYDLEIRNGRLIWNGLVFQGEDYTDRLRKDLPHFNW